MADRTDNVADALDQLELTTLARAMVAVLAAAKHAQAKHGRKCSRHVPTTTALPVLVEEVGEVAKALQEGDRAALKAELAQVAATSLMMLEWLIDEGTV